MKWSSVVSEKTSMGEAVAECASKITEDMDGEVPDLVVTFVSGHHAPSYREVPELVRKYFGDAMVFGCSGGGVIGDGHEIEQRPGLALTAAVLPDVEITPFHIDDDSLPDGDAPPDAWVDLVGVQPDKAPNLLMLADPFSMRGEQLLMGLDYAFPMSVKIGGLASGADGPGGNALYLSDQTFNSGVVGLAMHGDLAVDTIVAQGCRPIGEPMHVTECDQNLLKALDGRTPFEVLREMFDGLSPSDRELVQHSLFLGVVMDELNESPKLGDFLIRNIIGVDAQRGAVAVGESLKEGQTVQFHLRDADTSSEDLIAMLSKYVQGGTPPADSGALLFSCLGRGVHLYGRPDHDTELFRESVGSLPLTGFFCNGEIGQVRGSTYLHGYTSSFGIFRPKA